VRARKSTLRFSAPSNLRGPFPKKKKQTEKVISDYLCVKRQRSPVLDVRSTVRGREMAGDISVSPDERVVLFRYTPGTYERGSCGGRFVRVNDDECGHNRSVSLNDGRKRTPNTKTRLTNTI